MRWRSGSATSVLVAAVASAAFLAWHLPLLTPHGRIRGFDMDAAVIGLMGKKMLEGRGFDFFFWGQNFNGPLTSILVAAWGAVLGAADPLALRLAVFTEVLAGTLLIARAVGFLDHRAAVATLAGLVLTPPVVVRMLVTPLGAEMAFFMSAPLLLMAIQHLTAPPGRGCLSRPSGQIVYGLIAGLAWWFNQQVVFTLAATATVIVWRSALFARVRRFAQLRNRWLLRAEAFGGRRLPGVIEALVWLSTRLGALLFAAFLVLDLAGRAPLPFVFGPLIDAATLLVVPHLLLALSFGFRRDGPPLSAAERDELGAIACVAAGSLAGYAPVWLGRLLDWYPWYYGISFRTNYPSEMIEPAVRLWHTLPHWLALADGAPGAAFGIALLVLCAVALRLPSGPRVLLALIPAFNVLYFIAGNQATKPHYVITSVSAVYALAALGACDLWDAHGAAIRSAVAVAAILAVFSIGSSAQAMHRAVTNEPDPLPLLRKVEQAHCAVCYAHLEVAYRYRFLDRERRAWIVYLSQNRTRAESYEFQKRPGQRCLITNDGEVVKLAGDLRFVHPPPRSR